MKATDFVQIFELGKAFKEPKGPKKRSKRNYDFDDVDLTVLLHKRLQQAEALEKMLKDREKAHKKEDKKDEPKLSVPMLAAIFLASFPIIAPLYVTLMKHLLS